MALIYNASFDSQTRTLSLLDKAGNVISSCGMPSKGNELTLTATADNSSVKLIKNGTLSNTYEVNVGSGWTAYTFGNVINLNTDETVKWRCSSHPTTQSSSNFVQFVMTGSITASGYITSMVTSNFRNMSSLSGYDYAFSRLFSGCTALKNVQSLQCCQTLSPKCFYYSFSGCSSLEASSFTLLPPNAVLAESCCYGMYSNCSNITAGFAYGETLEDNCFYQMFYKCTKLTLVFTNAKTMGSATNAFKDWLYGVDTTPPPQYTPPLRFVYAYASLGLPTNSPSGIPYNWKRIEPTT